MRKLIPVLFALALMVGATPVLAATVLWKNVTWNNSYGSISMANSNLEVTSNSCFEQSCWGTAHYNTPGPFRAAATPWVKVTFQDEGPGTPGPQVWMEDETLGQASNKGGWTQFGAWDKYGTYRIYWWDYDTDRSEFVNTAIVRTKGQHTLKLGKRADGTVDYWLDGVLIYSTQDLTPNYFGDIYLAAHTKSHHPEADQATVVYVDYQTGMDYAGTW